MPDNGSIQELALSVPFFRNKVEAFLRESGLRLEDLDHYYAFCAPDGSILAGAGIKADIIKCVAVSPSARSEGYMLPLLSRIVSEAAAKGILNLKVFTKPENRGIFESIGFKVLASAPKAILMENGRGLEKYCEYLSGFFHCQRQPDARKCGVIVMNANPFTLGHKYLIEKALEQVDRLFVIPVKEDASAFPYSERLAMIRSSVMPGPDVSVMPDPDSSVTPGPDRASDLPASEQKYFSGSFPNNHFSSDITIPAHADALPSTEAAHPVISTGAEGVAEKSPIVLEGSDYCISAATFPTYFLKDMSDAAETQMMLDIDLFERHIMPALGATVRFVGSEPLDPLTARYNALMHNAVVIPRLVLPGSAVTPDSDSSVMPDTDWASALPSAEQNYFSGRCPKNQFSSANASPAHADAAVSASRVRAAIEAGDYASAAALCPSTTHPYLLAALAERALLLELNTPMKPGLVGPDGPGAHKDMDYDTMLMGIKALRPFWSRMAMASGPDELRSLGIEAEKAMLSATSGVNTHRGAIFALGMAVNAAGCRTETINNEQVMQNALCEIAQGILRNYLNNNELHSTLVGARRIALTGYSELLTDWLPFYRMAVKDTLSSASLRDPIRANAPERVSFTALQMTLLRIMSTLDDTCVIKRVGYDRAQEVKREAAALMASAQPSAEENYFSGRCPKNQFSPANAGLTHADALKDMCIRYAREGISPGGAADMLALTLFLYSILYDNTKP